MAICLTLTATGFSSVHAHDLALQPGIYTNVEEVYFDGEAERPVAPDVAISLEDDGDALSVRSIDPYGAGIAGDIDMGQLVQQSETRLSYAFADGRVTELRRARPVTCWAAVRKDEPKADSSEDWHFQTGIQMHDQGGRALVGGGDTGAQPVMIRLRNVTWDTGSTNKPVVSFYIHKPEDPVRAVSYSWASPDSERVGINLRWMQASCTIDDGEASKLSADKFRP